MRAPLFLVWLLLLTACAQSAAVATPAPTPTPAASAEHGRMLFQNKGCITCHANTRAAGRTIIRENPNLSSYTNDPAFLRRWLADPAAVRPGTQMPNLGLSPTEIEDLIAFLNEPR